MLSLANGARRTITICLAVIATDASEGNAGPLHEAVRSGDKIVLRELVSAGADLDETDWIIGSPLHLAVSLGSRELAQFLLESGANPDLASELEGAPALGIAASLGDVSMIGLLLQSGADPDLRDGDGMTPLTRAAQNGMTDAVLALAEAGATVDARQSGLGTTPLMWASLNGHVETVEALVALGAEVDALDQSGFSALMLAAQMQSYLNVGDGRLIEFLVASGADPLRQNEYGQTPREYAVSRAAVGWSEIAEVLKSIESKD